MPRWGNFGVIALKFRENSMKALRWGFVLLNMRILSDNIYKQYNNSKIKGL